MLLLLLSPYDKEAERLGLIRVGVDIRRCARRSARSALDAAADNSDDDDDDDDDDEFVGDAALAAAWICFCFLCARANEPRKIEHRNI